MAGGVLATARRGLWKSAAISESPTGDRKDARGDHTSGKGYVRRSRGVLVQSLGLCDRGGSTQRVIKRIISRSSQLQFGSPRMLSFDLVEKLSRGFYVVHSPEFLERVKSVQRLRFRIFKSAL